MKIIGLSGKMGTGKSTVSQSLQRLLGNWNIRGFATLLKQETAQLFNFPEIWCYTDIGKMRKVETANHPGAPQVYMTVRELLQWWGTDVRRKENPGCWIEAMAEYVKQLGCDGLIIDDVRFQDEANFIIDNGGFMIRIEPHRLWARKSVGAEHESETALDNFEHFNFTYTPTYGKPGLDANILARSMEDVQFI